MDSLRWVLGIAAVLLIGGIYVFESWRRARKARAKALDQLDEALLQGIDENRYTDGDWDVIGMEGLQEFSGRRGRDDSVDLGDLGGMSTAAVQDEGRVEVTAETFPVRESKTRVYSVAPRKTEGVDELIIVLNVMADPGEDFTGPEIRETLDEVDMAFGDMHIFHHYGVGEMRTNRPIFSLANILEPGFFDLQHLDDLTTPGLCLFMRLPVSIDGHVAYELMLNTGQRMARRLGGELRDETRSVLTPQAIAGMRERIAALGRQAEDEMEEA